jgi:hypothetical protein
MKLDEALAADRAGNIELAAALYEKAFEEGQRPLFAIVNLLVLYWQATDYGFWTGNQLSRDFVKRAGTRFREIMNEGTRLYPNSTELQFWRRYIAWADLGEAFNYDECEDLLKRGPKNLIPVIYLLDQQPTAQYDEPALRLLAECRDDSTTRSKYIASVIDGVLKRRRGRKRN